MTASYSREAGETVLGGPYHITATLSPAGVLTNYSITNAGASFHDRHAAGDMDNQRGEQDLRGWRSSAADNRER